MLIRVALCFLLAALAGAGRLSEECSGYEPEDCSRKANCKTCWDGRLDCYDIKEELYGALRGYVLYQTSLAFGHVAPQRLCSIWS